MKTSRFGEVKMGEASFALMDGGIDGVQGHSLFVEPDGTARWDWRLDGLHPSGRAGRGTLSLSEPERAWLDEAIAAAVAAGRAGGTSFFDADCLYPPRWVWAIIVREDRGWLVLEGGGLSHDAAPPELAPLLNWLGERVDREAEPPARGPTGLARFVAWFRRER